MGYRALLAVAFSTQGMIEVVQHVPLDEIIKATTQLIIAIGALVVMFRKRKADRRKS